MMTLFVLIFCTETAKAFANTEKYKIQQKAEKLDKSKKFGKKRNFAHSHCNWSFPCFPIAWREIAQLFE